MECTFTIFSSFPDCPFSNEEVYICDPVALVTPPNVSIKKGVYNSFFFFRRDVSSGTMAGASPDNGQSGKSRRPTQPYFPPLPLAMSHTIEYASPSPSSSSSLPQRQPSLPSASSVAAPSPTRSRTFDIGAPLSATKAAGEGECVMPSIGKPTGAAVAQFRGSAGRTRGIKPLPLRRPAPPDTTSAASLKQSSLAVAADSESSDNTAAAAALPVEEEVVVVIATPPPGVKLSATPARTYAPHPPLHSAVGGHRRLARTLSTKAAQMEDQTAATVVVGDDRRAFTPVAAAAAVDSTFTNSGLTFVSPLMRASLPASADTSTATATAAAAASAVHASVVEYRRACQSAVVLTPKGRVELVVAAGASVPPVSLSAPVTIRDVKCSLCCSAVGQALQLREADVDVIYVPGSPALQDAEPVEREHVVLRLRRRVW